MYSSVKNTWLATCYMQMKAQEQSLLINCEQMQMKSKEEHLLIVL